MPCFKCEHVTSWTWKCSSFFAIAIPLHLLYNFYGKSMKMFFKGKRGIYKIAITNVICTSMESYKVSKIWVHKDYQIQNTSFKKFKMQEKVWPHTISHFLLKIIIQLVISDNLEKGHRNHRMKLGIHTM